MLCCCKESDDSVEISNAEITELFKHETESRNFFHPNDAQIALSTHTPLYLPGRILHIVRNHQKHSGWSCGQEEPIYEAIWAKITDFDEVLISPTMANDHLPDKVLEALEKVLVCSSATSKADDNNDLKDGQNIEDKEMTDHRETSSSSTVFVINDREADDNHPSSSFNVFGISAECNNIEQSKKNSEEPKIIKKYLNDEILNCESLKKKLSLQIKNTDGAVSTSAAAAETIVSRTIPLASPEAFSESCSQLSTLDYKKNNAVSVNNRRTFVNHPSDVIYCLPALDSIYGETTPRLDQMEKNPLDEIISSSHPSSRVIFDEDGTAILVADDDRQSNRNQMNNSYERHSPDESSSDEFNSSVLHHFLYDDYAGHYSVAGRGYPHGFNSCNIHGNSCTGTAGTSTNGCGTGDFGCGSTHGGDPYEHDKTKSSLSLTVPVDNDDDDENDEEGDFNGYDNDNDVVVNVTSLH